MNCIVESTTDDEMDFQHRLRRQRPLPVLRVQLLVVQHLQMVRSESTNRDAPKRRKHMEVDLAAMPIPGALCQLKPLAR